MKKLLNSLQRTTSSTAFIPEIDGLRFVAITAVVLYHINIFIWNKNHYPYHPGQARDIISNVLGRGHLGVELFFVISGFILSYPFAAYYLKNTALISTKQYFIRRLTRLEPPYVLSLIVLFALSIFMGKFTFRELFPSLLASLSYTHNIFYPGQLPFINSVAWSLEIEVQFYILAPLLARVFSLPSFKRRLTLILSIILFTITQNLLHPYMVTIFSYMPYFLAGFLLSDLKLTKPRRIGHSPRFVLFLGVVSFCAIWLCDRQATPNLPVGESLALQLGSILSIFVFYYLVLFTPVWKRIFSIQVFTVLGGMCYSIYLLHYFIISLVGNQLVSRFNFSPHYAIDFLIHTVLLLCSIVLISALYFKMIEQPCMQRDWYLQLAKKIKTFWPLFPKRS